VSATDAVMTFPNTDEYCGEFSLNLGRPRCEGNGSLLSWAEGTMFIGSFVFDQRHGDGICYVRGGHVWRETWESGALISRGRAEDSDVDVRTWLSVCAGVSARALSLVLSHLKDEGVERLSDMRPFKNVDLERIGIPLIPRKRIIAVLRLSEETDDPFVRAWRYDAEWSGMSVADWFREHARLSVGNISAAVDVLTATQAAVQVTCAEDLLFMDDVDFERAGVKLVCRNAISAALNEFRPFGSTDEAEGAVDPASFARLPLNQEFQQIDAFDIIEQKAVSSGTHGRVVECRIKGSPGKYAVKRVQGVSNAAVVSMETELMLLGTLHHENIAALVSYAREATGAVALVMELYDNSLAGLMGKRNEDVRKGVMNWFDGSDVLDWLLQIACGLRYLHVEAPQAVAHRDIKTDNCLVVIGGIGQVQRVLLADFGISKVLEQSGTMTGQTFAGTPGYMAPEMVTGTYDALKCDVYAFGVLALALLCGLEPSKLTPLPVGHPLQFGLTKTAQQRVDDDDAFKWLFDQVYSTCATVNSDQRPSVNEALMLLEDHLA
jgi:Protein kinase domain